jgi:hypothetical protein
MQLNPDVVLIVAGNNWRSMLPVDAQGEVKALREGGYPGLLSYRQGIIRGLAEGTLRSIGEISKGHKARVVMVVPENNMRDFREPQPVAWLPGDGSPRWHALHARARAHLASGAHAPALGVADEMAALDGGTCSTTQRLRALALEGLGRREEARAAYSAEQSCIAGNRWFVEIPRTAPIIQDAFREAARAYGFSCVDLPALLRTDAGSFLPGRESFYDYCHFSTGLMRKLSAAMVHEVLRVTDKLPAGATPESITRLAPEPPPATDAAAKLGAALGNAVISREQGEVSEYWCEQALRASPRLAQDLLDCVELSTGPTPAVYTAAYRRVSQAEHGKVFFEFPGGVALEAMEKALRRVAPDAAEQLQAILQRNLGLGSAPLDLAQHAHTLAWSERFMPDFEWGVRGDNRRSFNSGPHYRSPWDTSRFWAVHDGQRDVLLELTARLPAVDGPRTGTVGVAVNGQPVGELALGSGWRKQAFTVPARAWRAGTNHVTLHWPALPPAGDAALRQVAERWEEGHSAAVPFPVFGEVFSLTAKTVTTAAAPG